MSRDSLQRFVFDNADVRGAVVTLEKEFGEMVSSREYSEGERHILGEFAAAVVLLVSQLKFEGTLSLQVRGGASVGLVVVECNDQYDFRGTVHDVAVAEPDSGFGALFAGGTLAMTISPREGHAYQGIVPLEEGSLAECLTEYFRQSEQLPSWFRLAASGNKVAGIMLQALPAQVCRDSEESRENWGRLVHLASTLGREEMLELSHEEILYRLYHEEQVRLFEPQPVNYRCQCSVERMERGLLALGVAELQDIIRDREDITTQCHFCGREYRFTCNDILALLQGSGPLASH